MSKPDGVIYQVIFKLVENILSDLRAKVRKKVIKNDNTAAMDFFFEKDVRVPPVQLWVNERSCTQIVDSIVGNTARRSGLKLQAPTTTYHPAPSPVLENSPLPDFKP